MTVPKSLIINSPFEAPRFHWQDERGQLQLVHGRRAAGYPGITSVTRSLLEHWTKRSALDAWVQGVNAKGGFGVWCRDVAFEPSEIHDIIQRHAA